MFATLCSCRPIITHRVLCVIYHDTTWRVGSAVSIEGVAEPMLFTCMLCAKENGIDGDAVVYFVSRGAEPLRHEMTLDAFLTHEPALVPGVLDETADLEAAFAHAVAMYEGSLMSMRVLFDAFYWRHVKFLINFHDWQNFSIRRCHLLDRHRLLNLRCQKEKIRR